MGFNDSVIQPNVLQLGFNAETLVHSATDFFGYMKGKIGRLTDSVSIGVEMFTNKTSDNVGSIVKNVDDFTKNLSTFRTYQTVFMILFIILLVILTITLIVFVCCLSFRARTEYKKKPFGGRKKKSIHPLNAPMHTISPYSLPTSPYAPYAVPIVSTNPPIFTTTTQHQPFPHADSVWPSIAPETESLSPDVQSQLAVRPSSAKSAPELFRPPSKATTKQSPSRSAPVMSTKLSQPVQVFEINKLLWDQIVLRHPVLYTPVITNGPTTIQPIFTTASIVTLAPSQPLSTTSTPIPPPISSTPKFGVTTPFTSAEGNTYPLQRTKKVQTTPPMVHDREAQKTPTETENRSIQTKWSSTPESSVKSLDGSRKSSKSSESSYDPHTRIPIERLERGLERGEIVV